MKSISRRLLVGLMVAVGLSSALTVALLVGYEARGAHDDLETQLESSVSAFAKLMEPALWDVDTTRVRRLMVAFGSDPRIASITVSERSLGSTQTITPNATTDTAARMMDVRRGDTVIGRVRVAFNRGYYRDQIRRQLVIALVVSLIALGAMFVALSVLLRRLVREPLDEMSATVRGYETGQNPAFATAVPYAEFAELGRVLDSMSGQIQKQFAALAMANRELSALNRVLVMARDVAEPSQLVTEVVRELRVLFDAACVRATLDTIGVQAQDGELHDGDVAAEVPVVANGQHLGALRIARAADRPLTPPELALADAVAAQLASAVAQLRARAAERLLRTAIDQLPESVIITDRDRRIVYVNPGFTATTGYAAEEALGTTARELKRASADDPGSAAMRAAVDAGKPWVGRLSNLKKSGEVYFEEMVITPVRDERGDVVNHVAIGRDVTAEMRRDERYRHAQRMEAVGELAGGIAHDFNNMIGAVLLQLELVEFDERLSPTFRRALQEMRESLERAANLTRQLLAFSRRQAMRVALHDLNPITAEMLRILTRVIGERIAIDYRPASYPVPFEGDAGMIEQIIVNLCVNARDAMPNGGRLTVSSRLKTFDDAADHPGTWAVLEIRDTGSGMTPEVRGRIFEPFFTTKDVGQGTGLGLAVTHGIVTQHGGWIDVESVVGEGTTFCVFLPARPGATPVAAPRAARAIGKGSATILLVEDETLVRHTVSKSLQRLGHRVIEAVTGPDAIRLWREQGDAIDLVITDMVMPGGLSGVQLLEQMRGTNGHVRSIVMSGYSLELSSDVLAPGISFLAKPFSLAALSEAVDDALGRGNGKA